MSDATYIPDYSEDQLEWLKPDLFSYGQISRSLRHVGSVTLLAQQKTDFAGHTRWADLPSVRLSLTQRPLFAGLEPVAVCFVPAPHPGLPRLDELARHCPDARPAR